MTLSNQQAEYTITTDVKMVKTVHGTVEVKTGDGTQTVKLPPHVAKFFQDKGIIA